MISEKDVQTYQRDGVIVVPEVLGADTLAQVRSVIAELVAGSAKTLEHTDVYDLEPGHTAEYPRVRRIKTPHKVHKLFDEIVRSEPVLEILKKLLGPGLRLHGSKLNMKTCPGSEERRSNPPVLLDVGRPVVVRQSTRYQIARAGTLQTLIGWSMAMVSHRRDAIS